MVPGSIQAHIPIGRMIYGGFKSLLEVLLTKKKGKGRLTYVPLRASH